MIGRINHESELVYQFTRLSPLLLIHFFGLLSEYLEEPYILLLS